MVDFCGRGMFSVGCALCCAHTWWNVEEGGVVWAWCSIVCTRKVGWVCVKDVIVCAQFCVYLQQSKEAGAGLALNGRNLKMYYYDIDILVKIEL